ncbi:MAG: M48 family metallopeptidase [Bryobacteraceae bacterium]
MNSFAAAIVAMSCFSGVAGFSETPGSCHVTFPPLSHNSYNIFSPQQEVDLGDAAVESELLDLRVLAEDDPMLQRIAARLARNAPLPGLQIHTFLVDMPQANAFVVPGGRIYVSRALIALLQTEDELAGIMAHELGHLLAHQQAIRVSRFLKVAMRVTEVGGRRDVFDKYNRLIESLWRDPEEIRRTWDKEEPEQIEADRLGLLIQAAAGYDTAAQVRAYDRLAETKGRTGNVFSNFFNFTPDEKRLGAMLKNAPAGCAQASVPAPADFAEWRERVLAETKPWMPESLHGVLSRLRLQPPLNGDLRQLRFSPDGQYVLAQDESGITVLTVRPFLVLFRAPAENAAFAAFTPDSREIVFVGSGTHVERWSIAGRARVEFTETPLRRPCETERLSPDGHTLACVDQAGGLRLIDVASSETIFEKKRFGTARDGVPGDDPGAARMDFSSDGRYFIAWAPRAATAVVARDLVQKSSVTLSGKLERLLGHNFAFLAPDRVMISPEVEPISRRDPDTLPDMLEPFPSMRQIAASPPLRKVSVTGTLVEFPSGKVLSQPQLPPGPLFRAADPGFVLVRPLGRFAVGAVEFQTGQMITGQAPALDVLGRNYVAERLMGELALYERGRGVQATVQLPEAELAGVRAAVASPDLRWVAVSDQTRAAVWNLATGEASLRFRAFDGGFFDARGHLLVDAPRYEEQKRHIVDIDLGRRDSQASPEVGNPVAKQAGPYVVSVRTRDGSRPAFVLDPRTFQDIVYDVLDARTMKTVWSKKYNGEGPLDFFEPSGRYGVFVWSPGSDRGSHDPALRDRLSMIHSQAMASWRMIQDDRLCYIADANPFGARSGSGVYLAETIDMATGEPKSRGVMDLGDRCLRIKNALPLHGGVVIEDDRNRVLVYDADIAEPRVRLFGHLLAADPTRGRLAIGKQTGRLVLYDAFSGEQTEEFSFLAPLIMVRFRDDGRALLELTSMREAITLEVR